MLIYRAMREGPDGLPLLGRTARDLGVRREEDIPVDSDGCVEPEIGGLSATPSDPARLPWHRRPRSLGGGGKDPVWALDLGVLGDPLAYRPDPLNPDVHGFIEPSRRVTFEEYEASIQATAPHWQREELER